MHGKTAFAILSAAAMASATKAPVTNNNPSGVVYEAVLPDEPFFPGGPNIKGSITAEAGPDGRGVKFNVHFENIPSEGGPFSYHLHEKPVTDGNCTSTGAHINPYGVDPKAKCNKDAPDTCEVGDLSGKHGTIDDAGVFQVTYQDDYASTHDSDDGFFGNKAFVLHYSGNNTRITCANFAKKSSSTPDQPPHGGNGTDTPTISGTGNIGAPSTAPPSSSPTESEAPISAAGHLGAWSASALFAVAGGAAMMFGI